MSGADTRRWRMLALLAFAELLGMAVWFGASAVAPDLVAAWGGPERAVAWMTSAVQLGFVIGTAAAALLNLADVVASRWYFATSAVLAAALNAAVAFAPDVRTALLLRLASGACLAGVYPPAMKMAATWFRDRRGLAIGVVVGALTIGKATPYMVNAVPGATPRGVVLAASLSAVAAAALVAALYHDGPYPFPQRRFSWTRAADVIRSRRWRLATAGYLGHMFELYSFWTWIPVFLAASAAARAAATGQTVPAWELSLLSFGTIAVGGAGCVWGGLVADRTGRERLVVRALAGSGACALLVGAAFGGPLWVVGAIAMVWGFFVIADSAQFSALVTESVDAHAVGTALTVQTSAGFLLTMASIQLVPPVAEVVGWQWAFAVLALGPAFGIAAVRRLAALGPSRA